MEASVTTFPILFSCNYWSFQVFCLLLTHFSSLYVPRKLFSVQIYFLIYQNLHIFSKIVEIKSMSVVISSFILNFVFFLLSDCSLLLVFKHLLVLMIKLTCLFFYFISPVILPSFLFFSLSFQDQPFQ